ncbi:mitochondrial protein-like protein Fmp25 [Microthyrium microscopicum]|uniref:Mitochondrial protein-like protein Fmp25 n=1 Tax=Microthyrium microscopicum TaxID=703497 RepID=A0A6A6TUG4_9PEZI|nr:mitochondrial protein-like protein Fmp25 [Microthyrium microscopicum]
MSLHRSACRAVPRLQRSVTASSRRRISTKSTGTGSSNYGNNWTYWGVAVVGGSATYLSTVSRLDADSGRADEVLAVLDRAALGKKQANVTEESRDLLNSPHLQVKRSWENPGVYAWGSNSGRVVAPDSEERFIKTPRRIAFFDGVLLRDIKLDKSFGAAINEQGDLLQWGTQFSPEVKSPEVTLKGKNLQSLAISDDRIIALSSNGSVYSIPVSRDEQLTDPRLKESSWLWSNSTNIGCRSLTPNSLGMGEKVISIAGGLQHVLMLTSSGRLFSAASSTRDFPERGQMGIPGLSWYTRPAGPFDQPHAITTLKGHSIRAIAAGDTHSLALDSTGRLFAFGDNSHGQLGIELNTSGLRLNQLNIDAYTIDAPTAVPLISLYPQAHAIPKITHIAAGGQNSYIVADAPTSTKTGQPTSDTWTCGRGIWGTLGNSKLTHVQWGFTRIPNLSALVEYNESTRQPSPIRVARISVGASHVAATMANITRVAAGKGGETDTNWGADVYFWGNNEHFQLGTGKRNNVTSPTHIAPLGSGKVTKSSQDGMVMERFQLTPKKTITFAGRSVAVEQRVECGRNVSAVYSAAV